LTNRNQRLREDRSGLALKYRFSLRGKPSPAQPNSGAREA